MTLPETIGEPSPLDPLLLLPLPKTLPHPPTADLEPLLSALGSQLDPSSSTHGAIPVTAFTAQMRSITRRSQTLLNAARVGAAEARQQLDLTDVDLRGVEYERDRVRDEIERCEDYEPIFRQLELPSEETFLDSADAEMLAALPAKDAEEYPYALMIARLESELAEIQQREELLAQLTKERDGLIKAKKEIKQKFDAVDVYLTDFAKTTNAVASKIRDVAKVPSAA